MPGATPKKTCVEPTAPSPDLLDLAEDLFGFRPPDFPAKAPAEAQEVAPEEVPSTAQEMTGKDLLEQPWSAMDAAGRAGNEALMEGYRKGRSHLHFLRSDSQPVMLRGVMRSMVPALVEELLLEVALDTPSARLLAEQVAEARADESYSRMLAGIEIDKAQIPAADKLHKAADRHSKRMATALEQLHRLRRPNVSVKIARAGNVNLGQQQVVNRSADTNTAEGGLGAAQPKEPSR